MSPINDRMIGAGLRVWLMLCLGLPGAAAWSGDAPTADRKPPVHVSADRIDGIADKEVRASGKAELRRGEVSVAADELKFQNDTEEVTASGNVRIERRGDTLTGPSLRYRMADDSGQIEKPEFTLAPRQRGASPPIGARGGAVSAEMLGEDRYRIRDATFTTCKPGDNGWYAQMNELNLDYTRNVGTATSATIYVLDKPVMHLPWLTFPLSNERKSGVLPPSIGSSDKGGLEATVPYYINLAPNYDMTIAGRYMAKRGLQANGQFRYLERHHAGELRFEMLPDDRALKTNRSALTFNHQYLDGGAFGNININKVSDDNYFRDLSSRINLTSQTNLNREGMLGYTGSWWSAGTYTAVARVQQFQTLQDPVTPVVTPYARAPQLQLNAVRQDVAGLDFSFAGEYVDFSHPTQVIGRRTTLNPSLSYPMLAPWGFITPKVSLHSTHYSLSREPAGIAASSGRLLPMVSLDGGFTFERQTSFGGRDMIQTLEPRAFYLRVPYRNQDRMPLFDTARADFNYAQIFSENSFAGGDRVGDANQLTLALTSRLLGAGSGQEAVRATVGQRFYFDDEQVGLTPTEARRNYKSSDWLAALSGNVARYWTAETAVQYNSRDQRTERLTVSARYKPEDYKLLNLSYRYLRNQVGQIDASTQWPLGGGWYSVLRYNYSLRDRRIVETLGGFEYNGDCWIGRVVIQRFATATGQSTNSIFLQIELNGFSRIGSNPLETLKRNIPGYSRLNQTVPSSNQTTDFFD